MKQNITEVKIGGAKRKNGHKLNCSCHICENIRNKAKRGGYEKEAELELEKINGGSKKKNGHTKNCNCPICINMKNSKKNKYHNNKITRRKRIRGGEQTEEDEDKIFPIEGGKKRKGNNHKINCKCPICKNMRNHKKGGGEEGFNNDKIDDNIENEMPASSSDYDELDKTIGGRKKRNNKTRKNKH